MYNAAVVSKRLTKLADTLRRDIDPTFTFREYTPEEVDGWVARLADAYDPEKEVLRRALTVDEVAFIRHEIHRCKADARYALTRYFWIKTKGQELVRFAFMESQEIIFARIAERELAAVRGETGDGILLAILKARQLGASTLTEGLIAHRVFFYGHTTGLVAGDVPEQTEYLFSMMVRIYDHLPWWMKPHRQYSVKGSQMYFDVQDSLVLGASGLSVRGGDSGQERGSMGTGKTIALAHLSELALWQNPYQIDDALMPSIPEHPRTLAIFESTAKGRGNWWHKLWQGATRGVKRPKPVFVPWYAESHTYTRPAPVGWTPSQDGIAHAVRAEEVSLEWVGRVVRLTREQLYWWECKRAEYIADNVLNKFLAEYAADPDEAFQHTTASVFDSQMLHSLRQQAQLPVLVEILPRTDLPTPAQKVQAAS